MFNITDHASLSRKSEYLPLCIEKIRQHFLRRQGSRVHNYRSEDSNTDGRRKHQRDDYEITEILAKPA